MNLPDHSSKTDREFMALLREQFLMLVEFAKVSRIYKNGKRVARLAAIRDEAAFAAAAIEKRLTCA